MDAALIARAEGVDAEMSRRDIEIGGFRKRDPGEGEPELAEGFVLGKTLVLIGILSVALITAGTTIVNHLAGQAVEAVQLRPVAAYAG
jgi:hypothetical protein